MPVIRLALADDELLFRAGLRALLDEVNEIDIVLEAKDGFDLVSRLSTLEALPEVILLDLSMPRMNGEETALFLQKKYSEIKVVALTANDSEYAISNMLRLGVAGYLIKKKCKIGDVLHVIHKVMEKGFHYGRDILEVMQKNAKEESPSRPSAEELGLSKREEEVLYLICKQYDTAEIAKLLNLSPRTIEGYRQRLMEKTDAKNVIGLVLFALKHNLFEIPEMLS